MNLVQRWLGHASMKTTAIYLLAIGAEECEIASRMWLTRRASLLESRSRRLSLVGRTVVREVKVEPKGGRRVSVFHQDAPRERRVFRTR